MKPGITNGDIQQLFLYGHMDVHTIRNTTEIKVSGFEINEVVTINSSNAQHDMPIVFHNCDFNSALTVMEYTTTRSLRFSNCRFKKDVHASIRNRPLEFNNDCEFEGSLFVTSLSSSNFKIEDSILNQTLSLTGDFSENAIFKKINYISDQQKLKGKLHINSCTFLTVAFLECSFDEILINGNSSFKYEADFVYINTNSFHCSLTKIGLVIRFRNSNIGKFRMDNIHDKAKKVYISDRSAVDDIELPLAQFDSFEIVASVVGVLKVSGTNGKESNFSIEKTSIKSLVFEKVINEGSISFKEIIAHKSSLISITSSSLAKTDFILCDFSKAMFEFENSKLTECFLAETDFPKTVFTGDKPNYSQAQLAFGQLSAAFQKQGDTIRSIEYQAREVEAHFKGMKFFSKDFFAKLNLSLNFISSYFGRYWALGILFTFGIGLGMFYLVVINSQEYQFGLGLSYNPKVFPSFLKFMNPLRFLETESIFKINADKPYLTLSQLSYFWDFLGRVFVAYGFYQTIQAFRRFGRR